MTDLFTTGQGDGTDNATPPLVAFIAINPETTIAAGHLPWPPFEPCEAPPCGHRMVWPCDATTDNRERTYWCDLPDGHETAETDTTTYERGLDPDHHRAVTDLDEGTSIHWHTKETT